MLAGPGDGVAAGARAAPGRRRDPRERRSRRGARPARRGVPRRLDAGDRAARRRCCARAGCVVRCLGDLLLERATVPTIGVTGTAGKTTTAASSRLPPQRPARPCHTSTTARAANLWPTAELLPPPTDGVLVMELTSSHLCFTTQSPTIAVITCFWPDHLELHGSLDALPGGEGGDRPPAGRRTTSWSSTRTTQAPLRSPTSPPAGGSASRRRARWMPAHSCEERKSCSATRSGERTFRLPTTLDGPRIQALLAAAATALAAGALPKQLAARRRSPVPRDPRRADRRHRADRRRHGGDARPRRRRPSTSVPTARSCSSPAASSRTPGSRSMPRRRKQLLLEQACARGPPGRAARRPLRACRRRGSRRSSTTTADRRADDLDAAIRLASDRACGRRRARRLADVPAPTRRSRADRTRARSARRPGIAPRIPRYLY